MLTNERKTFIVIITLTVLAVILCTIIASTMEGTASLSGCAGCLKMAAGLAN